MSDPVDPQKLGSELRLFIALLLPAQIVAASRRAQEALNRQLRSRHIAVRLAKPDQLHLTTKFLGNLPRSCLASLSERLERSRQGVDKIGSALKRLDAFPNPRRGRVIVLKLQDPRAELRDMARRCEVAATSLGVAAESREFVPHITLARLKKPQNLTPWLSELALQPEAFEFDELALMASELGPEGSVYTELRRWQLGRPTSAG